MNTATKKHTDGLDTAYAQKAMQDLIAQLRRDVEHLDEPRAQALFETSAEVLQGLTKAFADYEAGREAAFQR